MALAREPTARVFLIVFVDGLGEVVFGDGRADRPVPDGRGPGRGEGDRRPRRGGRGDVGGARRRHGRDVGLALRRGLGRLRDDLTDASTANRTGYATSTDPDAIEPSTDEYRPEPFPRRWLPADTELKTWEQIEPWYRKLLDRAIGSPAELEAWLSDVGELNAAVGQEGVEPLHRHDLPDRRPRARGGATWSSSARSSRRLKPLQNAIREKYLDSPHRAGLPRDRYRVFDRAQAEPPRTLPGGEHPARDGARRAGTAIPEDRRRDDRPVPGPGAHARADGPVPRRDRPAASRQDGLGTRRRPAAGRPRCARRPVRPDGRAPRRGRPRGGFPRLRRLRLPAPRAVRLRGRARPRRSRTRSRRSSCRWRVGSRRSAGRRSGSRRSAPGTSRSTRWAGPRCGRSRTSSSSPSGPRRSSTGVDPDLGRQFRYLRTHGLLDLANRKGKAPGGYQTTLEDDRLPFIFMNAVGRRRRRPHALARRGPRLPRPGQPGRDAGRLPRKPDRVLRGRVDVDGAARRRRPRGVLQRPTTPTALTGSCSKGSS